MDLKIKGKAAFISGSTAGIGLAIAKRLLEEGVQVIINGRTQDNIDKVVSELKTLNSDYHISGIAADFSKKGYVDKLLKELPDIDILV